MRRFIIALGHGRLLEANYIIWKLIVGATMFWPQTQPQIRALSPLKWYIPDQLIAAPFLGIGIIQLVGWLMNLWGYEESWMLRMAGAGAACGMWTWLLWQSITFGVSSGSTIATSICGLVASLLLCYLAYHRMPIPGFPRPL